MFYFCIDPRTISIRHGVTRDLSMFQSDLLKDKCVLITGGGTGLGKSMGRRVLALGARLVISGRREAVLEEATAEFDADFPGRTRPLPCDMRDAAPVDKLVAALWEDGRPPRRTEAQRG